MKTAESPPSDAWGGGSQTDEILSEKIDEEQLLENLMQINEFEERSEPGDRVSATLQKIRKHLICTLCRQMLQNPQLYVNSRSPLVLSFEPSTSFVIFSVVTLRAIGASTQSLYDGAPMIDTDS
ncbi:hypothetical protein Clacol_004514 [Clathrus columnatus]|uniref:Uncharacterized protein n=1 Tax=Clathrus columnatus TaxID=1419009 RepID=A0AAV5ACB3_9AGAM|nr:hypothetical protein Clacol_004514 [Clathrus columnatus]